MLKTKTILIVHTEFQLLSALSIIFEKKQKFDHEMAYTILIVVPKESSRFKFNWNFDELVDIEFRFYDIDQYKFKYQQDFKEILTYFKSLNGIYELIIFNRLSFVSLYIIHNIVNLKTTILSLGPDGAAAYVYQKKIAPRWALFEFFACTKFLFANKVYKVIFHFPSLKYADLGKIKILYLPMIDVFNNTFNKKLVEYKFLDKSIVNKISTIFSFDINNCITKTDSIVFYCNQPFYNEKIYDIELKVCKYLIEKYNADNVYIKLHPSTEPLQKERLLELECKCLETNYPAELIMACITNSKIISFWSTVNFFNSESNLSYWLYPILDRLKIMNNHIGIYDFHSHIIKVDKIENL